MSGEDAALRQGSTTEGGEGVSRRARTSSMSGEDAALRQGSTTGAGELVLRRARTSSGVLRAEMLKVVTLPWVWLGVALTWSVALIVALAVRRAYPVDDVAQLAPQIAMYPVAAACAAVGAVMGAHEYPRQWRTTLLAMPARGLACAGRCAVLLAASSALGLGTSAAIIAGLAAPTGHLSGDDLALILPTAAFCALMSVFGRLLAETTRSAIPSAVTVLVVLWIPPAIESAVPELARWLPTAAAWRLLAGSPPDAADIATIAAWLVAAVCAAAYAQRRDV